MIPKTKADIRAKANEVAEQIIPYRATHFRDEVAQNAAAELRERENVGRIVQLQAWRRG